MRVIALRVSIFIALAVVIGAEIRFHTFSYLVEDASFLLDPSASRALKIGESHLDAKDPRDYDFARAEHFLRIAYSMDHELPLVNLDMARVAFLKGDFVDAMRSINAQILLTGDEQPNAYYIRGLIEGYMGNYDGSIRDYSHYVSLDPHNWAAVNDLAWALLKAGRSIEAASITGRALNEAPDNPWLLNTNAIALYEMGDTRQAAAKSLAAIKAAEKLSVHEWLVAYPGNDPRIAAQGILSLQRSALENMHMIGEASSSARVQ